VITERIPPALRAGIARAAGRGLSVLLGLWLVLTAIFFLVRFTAVFYTDNLTAMERLLGL